MDDSSGVATGKRGAEELESAENGIFVGDGGGGGDASAALPAAAPKQLRKKSVSFTGEETYQVRAVIIFSISCVPCMRLWDCLIAMDVRVRRSSQFLRTTK